MPECYRVGPAEVRPTERRLTVDGRETPLGARAFDLLLALLAHPDRLLTKQELLSLVWPGMVVEESNLSVQVSVLRKALGPNLIATIPGRGYRLSAWVERLPAAHPTTPPTAHTTADKSSGTAAGPDAATAPASGPPPRAGLPTPGQASPAAPAVAAPPAAPERTVPALRGAAALAADRGPLLGRRPELADLARCVPAHRLTTLVGPGGIGKTRLAIAAAEALAPGFADGACLVELVGLRAPADLASETAQALGMLLPGARPPVDELCERLRDQSVLLVLDNCEHVIGEAAAFVQALLRATRGVHVLATSQEPLRLGAEQLLRLGALEIPAAGTPAHAAGDAGAVALFRDRVRAAQPGFDIDEGNVTAVIDICRQLDGSPLAIELAAGRVGLLGVAGVHGHLAARLRLLASPQRDQAARHRTLRATLDWSHALLGEREQRLFRQLGVMVGGFGLELAAQVAGADPADGDAWLDALATLVDRSLVVVEGEARPHYRLLESARLYALDKLAEHGETAALRERHARGLLQALRANLSRAPGDRLSEDDWTLTFAAEVDNLRAALDWAGGPDGHAALALDLLAVAAPLMYQLGRFNECLQWFQAGRRLLGPDTPALARAGFEFGLAVVGLYALPYAERMALLTSAIGVFTEHRQFGRLVPVHCMAAYISAVAGRYAEAQQHLDACEPLFTRFPALATMRARWLFPAAVVHLGQGQAAQALACIEHALPLARAAGDSRTAAYLLTNRGVALHVAGRLDEAERCIVDFLAGRGARATFNMAASEAFAHAYLIRLDVERGAVERAAARLRQALPLMRRATGARQFAGTLACLAAAQGRLREAALLLGADSAGRHHRGEALPWLEQRVAAATRAQVRARHPEPTLAAWEAEGAELDDAAIEALARGD